MLPKFSVNMKLTFSFIWNPAHCGCQKLLNFCFILGGFSPIQQGMFGLIRTKWKDNFLPGFLAWLKLFRESTFHPGRRSPHYTQSDSSPLLTPPPLLSPFSLRCWPWFWKSAACQSSTAALIVMLIMSSGTLLSFLSSPWCLCFLNHAALGRSKGTVRILLLTSLPHLCVCRTLHDLQEVPCVVCVSETLEVWPRRTL